MMVSSIAPTHGTLEVDAVSISRRDGRGKDDLLECRVPIRRLWIASEGKIGHARYGGVNRFVVRCLHIRVIAS